MESNDFLRMLQSIVEKRSRIKENLRLKVLLKSQYDLVYRSYFAGISNDDDSLASAVLRNLALTKSQSTNIPNSNETSNKNVISKKRSIHSMGKQSLQNKRMKTVANGSTSLYADCLTSNINNNQNSHVQSLRQPSPLSQTFGRYGKENDISNHFSRYNIVKNSVKNMLEVLKDWLKNCGINLDVKENYFSPYLEHPIYSSQYEGITHLHSWWKDYVMLCSSEMTSFQRRKNTKILQIMQKLVKQYEAYKETNGDKEILNLQLRKNRCKLKKLVRKAFADMYS